MFVNEDGFEKQTVPTYYNQLFSTKKATIVKSYGCENLFIFAKTVFGKCYSWQISIINYIGIYKV